MTKSKDACADTHTMMMGNNNIGLLSVGIEYRW